MSRLLCGRLCAVPRLSHAKNKWENVGVVLLDIRHLRIHFLYRLDSLRVLKAGNWGYDGMRDAMAGHSGSNDLNAPAHVQSGATANMHVNIYYFAH